ncbi:MAG: hypothetical protein M3Q46_09075 [Verrucomicrobiota bacterium]|nr:hypothetical protein [Verrucomicrobiota bacterium]
MRSRTVNVMAYWLLPAPPARAYFRELIRGLAAANDALPFEPHLTLAVGPDEPWAMDRTLAKCTPGVIEVRAIEVGFASVFTRTLFVRFEANAALLRLRSSLGEDGQEQFDPHVSLLYQNLSPSRQAELAQEIHLPFATVAFDSVAVTRCRIPVASNADVALWETIAVCQL